MLRSALALLLLLPGASAVAQFTMQDSGTTADLRGIVNVGNGTAWASGNHGTVLRTEDSGFVWQGCAVPTGAEQLDFRGIQAFDDQTAIVMSSGKGDLSRVYKTTDGCKSWKLVFTNPDADGFFDGVLMNPRGEQAIHNYGILVGDPVDGMFSIFFTVDRGSHWEPMRGRPRALRGEALFAASNQSVAWTTLPNSFFIVTGGVSGPRLLRFEICGDAPTRDCEQRYQPSVGRMPVGSPFERGWEAEKLPLPSSPSGGAFAASEAYVDKHWSGVIVGGDYLRSESENSTASWWQLQIGHSPWRTAVHAPHGFRSSVAYDAKSKTWITVGPNGTDISTDDGRNWRALKPGYGDEPDADKQWNGLSLPYVVGPHGRIGRLRDNALLPGK